MLQAFWEFAKHEVSPRWKSVLVSTESLAALCVGSFFGLFGKQFFYDRPQIGELSGVLLAYASIAFGFCIAGLTVALTLPDEQFVTKLASTRLRGERTDAYSDLLFVFSWTALAHWLCIVSLIVTVLFGGTATALIPSNASAMRRLGGAAVACVCAYSLLQFGIALITVSQIGRVYISELKKRRTPTTK